MEDKRRWKCPAATWSKLLPHAQHMRANPTPAAKLLWERLRNKQLGVKFRREHAIGRYLVDFYCSQARLAIELDGLHHQEQRLYDEERTMLIEEHGVRVIRFSNEEVLSDADDVVRRIEAAVLEAERNASVSPA
jgi:very-short-patch-repair endonuclease